MAEVRHVYQHAATLREWTMQPGDEPGSFVFTAKVVDVHGYWITQQPLDLVVSVGTTKWYWSNIALQRQGDECTVVLRGVPAATKGEIAQ